MYRVINVLVRKNHHLYPYFVEVSKLATNLYNATLFRQRQWLTMQDKEVLTDNEQEVLDEINNTIAKCNKPKPGKIMNRTFLYSLMSVNKNVDYYSGIPRHTASAVFNETIENLKSYFASAKDYKEHPEKYTGKPKLTKYKTKKSMSTFTCSNQECVIHTSKKGNYYLKFPLTKEILNLGKKVEGELKEVTVTPMHGVFQVAIVMENNVQTEIKPIERIVALDPGVNNLLAVTNNCGLECILFDGKPIKAKNQYYNKKIALEMSKQTLVTKTYFVPNKEYKRLTLKRNNQIRDYMFKTARYLINWCLENNIDTIVAGKNKLWKQEVKTGNSNNQNFVFIPHAKLYRIIKDLCEYYGINYFEQEESYTSKASYLDNDYIPEYGVDDENANFSGKRMYRGLYRSSNGTKINADLNGSANILRKFCGQIFKIDFRNILKVSL